MELCGKNLIVYDFVNFGSLFLDMLVLVLGMPVSVGPQLWFELKYLNNYSMDCYKVLYKMFSMKVQRRCKEGVVVGVVLHR